MLSAFSGLAQLEKNEEDDAAPEEKAHHELAWKKVQDEHDEAELRGLDVPAKRTRLSLGANKRK